MPTLTAGEATLYFEDTGGNGAPVIFSHGILMDHEMFSPQVDALRDDFRCVTWDERGHGSTTQEGSWTYWDSARDLLGLMDRLEIDSAFLVGMSQGGFVQLRSALLAPKRVRGLAFIDSQAGPEDPAMQPTYDALLEAWQAEPTRELAEMVAAIILGPADHEPWVSKWLARPPEDIVEPYRTLTGREDLHDRLAEIHAPAIVIHGDADTAIAMDKAEALCAGLPSCEGLFRIEGGGHAANLSHPEIVTETLRDFLRRHAA